MYLTNAKTTVASSRFPGSASPPRFAELPLDGLYVSPANVRSHGAASDWNRTDPPHGAAILKLLEWIETHPTVSLTPTSQAAP